MWRYSRRFWPVGGARGSGRQAARQYAPPRLGTEGQGAAGLLSLEQSHRSGDHRELPRAAGAAAASHGSEPRTRSRWDHDHVAGAPLRDVQPDGCLPHHRRARAEPRRSGDAGYGVTGLSWVGRSEDPTRRTPPSPRLEPDLLVGRGEEVTGDQAQPRLRDPRSPCVEDGDLPDRRDRDALVDELLDSM